MSREMHDGRKDGLTPLVPLDVRGAKGFADLLRGMGQTAFAGRALGEALEILLEARRDPGCRFIVTLSGAMTVAKQGRVLCEMIEAGLAHMIISTGALMAHGLSEDVGCSHYKYDPRMSDQQLYDRGYNRIYDTLEMEANLDDVETVLDEVMAAWDAKIPLCSHTLNRATGDYLIKKGRGLSILGAAARHDVPVYVPAFTDSEIALGVAAHFVAARGLAADANAEQTFAQPPAFNPFYDLYDFTRRVVQAERLAIFTIGGGVPRNWGQQAAPFIEILNRRAGLDLRVPRIKYAVRICPEPVHWGGLSGCTYTEGVSWGKFVPREQGGRHAEVLCDATVAWPILVRGLLEALGRV